MRRLIKPVVGAFAMAALLTACGDDDDDSGGRPVPDYSAITTSGTITIENFAFGEPLTVRPGATIEIVNKDDKPHNVAAVDETSFRSIDLQEDQKTTMVVPSAPGTYDFICTFHPQMKGQLIVSDSAPAPAPSSAPTSVENPEIPAGPAPGSY